MAEENKNKTVVLSTTNNADYKFYIPYQEKAWNNLGWKVCIIITNDVDISTLNLPIKTNGINKLETTIITLPDIPELRKETIAQAGRLYAANYFPDDMLLMTCDMDLIPLADYWHPGQDDITVYGHDLTWRSFYPMGYIAMNVANWKKYMNLNGKIREEIIRDAKEIEIAYMPDWNQWWNHDWTLITKRLKPFEKQITFIDRGQIEIAGATLAKGRIDRYNWEATQNQPEPFIDMHCENNNTQHPVKLEPFLKVFEKFYGKILHH